MLLHVLGPRVNKIYYYYYGYEIFTQYTFIEFPDFYLSGILIFSFFFVKIINFPDSPYSYFFGKGGVKYL